MTIWPDHCLLDLLGIELPIILAPMAGSGTAALQKPAGSARWLARY
jgi:nitronate monooxygenase